MFGVIMKNKRTLTAIGIVLLLSLFPISIYAAIDKSNPVCTITDAQNDESKIKTWVDTCNSTLKNNEFNITFVEATSQKQSNGVVNVDIRINMKDYNEDFETKDQQEIYSLVFKTISDSQMSKSSQNKIYNFISAQDKSTSSLVI